MDQVTEILQDRIKVLQSDVKSILVTQAQQAKVLEDHIRRTNLLEESVGLLRSEISPLTQREIARAAFTRVGGAIIGLLSAGGVVIEILHRLKFL